MGKEKGRLKTLSSPRRQPPRLLQAVGLHRLGLWLGAVLGRPCAGRSGRVPARRGQRRPAERPRDPVGTRHPAGGQGLGDGGLRDCHRPGDVERAVPRAHQDQRDARLHGQGRCRSPATRHHLLLPLHGRRRGLADRPNQDTAGRHGQPPAHGGGELLELRLRLLQCLCPHRRARRPRPGTAPGRLHLRIRQWHLRLGAPPVCRRPRS
jgi:hypothetical protein